MPATGPGEGRPGERRPGARARAAAWSRGAAPARSAGGRSLPSLREWSVRCLEREVDERRLFPWLAVMFGAGILLAFAAEGPLSAWPPVAAALLFGSLAWLARASLVRLAPLLALAALFAGFAAAAVRMQAVETSVLQRVTTARAEGFVESVEERAGGGGRIVLRLARLDTVAEGARPFRVRVTARSLAGITPGDYVGGTLRLMPPPEAARPGGYDFARDAYFRRIGAVGSVPSKLGRLAAPATGPDLALRLAARVDSARNVLTTRIATTIGGQAGAVSAALVTGKRGLIDERTNEILRAAGIYHVVSISGLHMVLAAGVFFYLTRAGLALSPALALGWPIKKIAALVGMAGAACYCVFSGAEVATERALVMILVMQGAILFDRPALSMRNLAISALLVLAREPEALLGPSFQMSYAAVAGLIAFAELARRYRPASEPGDPIRRAALWVGAVVLGTLTTTVVATLATGPFGAFHFNNLQPYGLIGNAATLPLISFAVMPAAVLGVVALPFGLDRPVWVAMGWATAAVLRLSEWVAGFAGSVVTVPAFETPALLLLTLAILCATLFASALRFVAVLPAALGVALAAAPTRPDIFIARDGRGAAVRGADGRLTVLGRVSDFTAAQWLRADGDARRAAEPSLKAGTRCDPIGCTVALPDGRVVSYLADRRGFEEDCRRAAVVISRLWAPAGCGAKLLIDGRFLRGHGATAIVATPHGFTVSTARRPDDSRPWLVRSGPTEAGPPARDRQPAAPQPRERPIAADTDGAASDLPEADAVP